MKKQYARTAMIFGEENIKKLNAASVAVFGVGGVGGFVAEALARSGVGSIDLIDSDTVSESNINRQIIALHSTVGMPKTEAMAARIHDIDPDIKVCCHNMFYLPETSSEIDLSQFDMIIDAVDTVTAKLELISNADRLGAKIISSMGTGNKTDPTQLKIGDIYKTSMCPLARVIRLECKKRRIKRLCVLYSTEQPKKAIPLSQLPDWEQLPESSKRRSIPGSCAFVPSAAGLIIAGEAVRQLIAGNAQHD